MLKRKLVRASEWRQLIKDLETYHGDVASATQFVREIEKGNLDASIDQDRSTSELAASLVSMRDQMKKFANEEKERSWVNEGMAKFVEILRSRKNENLHTLADNVIRNLVSYIRANQGGLFLVNDEDQSNTYLELVACYAYDRRKFLEKRVEIGEGILGQAVLEKRSVYLKEVPPNFVKITSGLGEALPRNILVVPLKLEDEVYGVIELAAFEILKQHQIEFVERLGESIASTIAGVKGKDRTEALLASTQQHAEEMRAQEEEMRQNMEELAATQEEMQRVMKEMEGKEAYVTNLLNVSKDLIFTIDHEYKLKTWNQAFAKSLEGFGMRVERGMDTMVWYSGDEAKKQIDLYHRVFAGETVEFTMPSTINGETFYFLTINAPLRDKSGRVIEVAVFSKDVTAMKNAQEKAESLLAEAQLQTEQMKAQEEEMRQNMEELSATQEEMHRVMKEVEGKEYYMRKLLDVSVDSIFTIDRQYQLVTWNETFAKSLERFGMRVEKGASTLDWYQPDQVDAQVKLYDRAFAGEIIEFTAPTDINGETFYFLSTYAPLKNDKGEITEVAVFGKDVTAITRAQKEMEKLQNDLQAREKVLGITTILSEADIYGTITFVNDKLCEVSKYSREELIGKPHNIFRHPEMPKELFKKMWEALKRGDTFKGIIKNRAKDGTHYWVDAAIVPIKDESGKIVKFIGARYHITNDWMAEELFKAQGFK